MTLDEMSNYMGKMRRITELEIEYGRVFIFTADPFHHTVQVESVLSLNYLLVTHDVSSAAHSCIVDIMSMRRTEKDDNIMQALYPFLHRANAMIDKCEWVKCAGQLLGICWFVGWFVETRNFAKFLYADQMREWYVNVKRTWGLLLEQGDEALGLGLNYVDGCDRDQRVQLMRMLDSIDAIMEANRK